MILGRLYIIILLLVSYPFTFSRRTYTQIPNCPPITRNVTSELKSTSKKNVFFYQSDARNCDKSKGEGLYCCADGFIKIDWFYSESKLGPWLSWDPINSWIIGGMELDQRGQEVTFRCTLAPSIFNVYSKCTITDARNCTISSHPMKVRLITASDPNSKSSIEEASFSPHVKQFVALSGNISVPCTAVVGEMHTGWIEWLMRMEDGSFQSMSKVKFESEDVDRVVTDQFEKRFAVISYRESNNQKIISELNVIKVETSDYTIYKCVAQNTNGKSEYYITLLNTRVDTIGLQMTLVGLTCLIVFALILCAVTYVFRHCIYAKWHLRNSNMEPRKESSQPYDIVFIYERCNDSLYKELTPLASKFENIGFNVHLFDVDPGAGTPFEVKMAEVIQPFNQLAIFFISKNSVLDHKWIHVFERFDSVYQNYTSNTTRSNGLNVVVPFCSGSDRLTNVEHLFPSTNSTVRITPRDTVRQTPRPIKAVFVITESGPEWERIRKDLMSHHEIYWNRLKAELSSIHFLTLSNVFFWHKHTNENIPNFITRWTCFLYTDWWLFQWLLCHTPIKLI